MIMNTPNLHNQINPAMPPQQPVLEQPQNVLGQSESALPRREIPPTVPRPEVAPQPSASTGVVSQVPAPTAVVQNNPAPNAQQVHTDSSTARDMFNKSIEQFEAADVDLIEEPWVKKTDEIIANDKDDPSVEDEHQHQLNKVYLKKRFNLDVS